jgi:hypothetical protein
VISSEKRKKQQMPSSGYIPGVIPKSAHPIVQGGTTSFSLLVPEPKPELNPIAVTI